MKTDLSPAEAAILGLVAEGPRHGYELDEIIEARGLREWAEIGFSSIYFHLQKLERKGFIRQAAKGAGGKARKLYAITPDGVRALRAKAIAMLAQPQRLYPPLLVGLANWPLIPEAQAREALSRRRGVLASEKARLESMRSARRPLPPFVDAMFGYGLAMIEAELGWIAESFEGAAIGEARSQKGA
jgi:DNA-binding PadR family transcriptional regulator